MSEQLLAGWIKFKGSRGRHFYKRGDKKTRCGLSVHDDDLIRTSWIVSENDVFKRMRCLRCMMLLGYSKLEAKISKTPDRIID